RQNHRIVGLSSPPQHRETPRSVGGDQNQPHIGISERRRALCGNCERSIRRRSRTAVLPAIGLRHRVLPGAAFSTAT
ncbi:hypothetical protein VIGAN_02329300, partial [Vigna angularis var. angularis]